jgi:hypothetical protein
MESIWDADKISGWASAVLGALDAEVGGEGYRRCMRRREAGGMLRVVAGDGDCDDSAGHDGDKSHRGHQGEMFSGEPDVVG